MVKERIIILSSLQWHIPQCTENLRRKKWRSSTARKISWLERLYSYMPDGITTYSHELNIPLKKGMFGFICHWFQIFHIWLWSFHKKLLQGVPKHWTEAKNPSGTSFSPTTTVPSSTSHRNWLNRGHYPKCSQSHTQGSKEGCYSYASQCQQGYYPNQKAANGVKTIRNYWDIVLLLFRNFDTQLFWIEYTQKMNNVILCSFITFPMVRWKLWSLLRETLGTHSLDFCAQHTYLSLTQAEMIQSSTHRLIST